MKQKENVIKKNPLANKCQGIKKTINNQIKTFFKNDDTPTFKWLFQICQ